MEEMVLKRCQHPCKTPKPDAEARRNLHPDLYPYVRIRKPEKDQML
jgi:hypothetical protein